MSNYIYKGDRFTDHAFKNKQCKAVRRQDGECIRGKNGNMLVEFDGVRVNVIARQLRKMRQPALTDKEKALVHFIAKVLVHSVEV